MTELVEGLQRALTLSGEQLATRSGELAAAKEEANEIDTIIRRRMGAVQGLEMVNEQELKTLDQQERQRGLVHGTRVHEVVRDEGEAGFSHSIKRHTLAERTVEELARVAWREAKEAREAGAQAARGPKAQEPRETPPEQVTVIAGSEGASGAKRRWRQAKDTRKAQKASGDSTPTPGEGTDADQATSEGTGPSVLFETGMRVAPVEPGMKREEFLSVQAVRRIAGVLDGQQSKVVGENAKREVKSCRMSATTRAENVKQTREWVCKLMEKSTRCSRQVGAPIVMTSPE